MNVVVIGGLHHNTLGVIRSLAEKKEIEKIETLIVAKDFSDNNIISKSKYVAPGNLSYVDSDKQIVPWLINRGNDGTKNIIICCSDGSAIQVMKHKNLLCDKYYLPETTVDIRELASKEVQAAYAKKCGLSIPDSMVLHKGEKCEWRTFPCIVKPLKSVIGAGKADIFIAKNDEELKCFLNEVKAEDVQIQKYMIKEIEYQLIGCSLDAGKQIIIPGFTNILRQPENTNTGYLRYSPISVFDYDKKSVETFIREIGYSGLFSIEFVRAEDGVDYFLEINLRNDGNAYCVTSAGINLPYIWCYYSLNKIIPKDEKVEFHSPIMFIPDFSDLLRGIKTVGMCTWIKQFIKAESHSIWNRKDIKPFFVALFGLVKRFMGK